MKPKETKHVFGGDWTDKKIETLKKYLETYASIFERNEKAKRYLKPIYIDAFAGTGFRNCKTESRDEKTFDMFNEKETEQLLKGSATIALEVEPSFQKYIFIERSPKRIKELKKLKQKYPEKADRILIAEGDANKFLPTWCQQMKKNERAVVFLDPYGLEISWNLIECLAKTERIDLWFWFPISGVMRNLPKKSQKLSSHHEKILTKIFGEEDWESQFYPQDRPEIQLSLLPEEVEIERNANWTSLGSYINQRLKTVFTNVARNPQLVNNTKNVPLYMLCFAAKHTRAREIAEDFLEDLRKSYGK